jgi:hypothetical protein
MGRVLDINYNSINCINFYHLRDALFYDLAGNRKGTDNKQVFWSINNRPHLSTNG